MPQMIFIVGPPRSGTTLLLGMLVKEQKEVGGSFEESQFYAAYRFKNPSFKTYIRNTYFKTLMYEKELKILFDQNPKPIDFFKRIIEQYCIREKKNLFVEKSPVHTLYYKEILKDFPEAKFIIIQRDICANVQSYISGANWVKLRLDKYPSFIRDRRSLRYFSAFVTLYEYKEKLEELETLDACLTKISYEDLVLNKVDLQAIVKDTLNISLDKPFISRPFSTYVEHRDYAMDQTRIEGYKKLMPQHIQWIARLIFEPSTGFKYILQKILVYLFLKPFISLKHLLR